MLLSKSSKEEEAGQNAKFNNDLTRDAEEVTVKRDSPKQTKHAHSRECANEQKYPPLILILQTTQAN